MLLNSAERDPACRGRLGATLITLVLLWPLWQATEVKPSALWASGNFQVIANFLASFLPPESGSEFIAMLIIATQETLAIATAGLLLAIVIALPLGYLVSNAGREKITLNPLARSVLTVLRGIPELVLALVFVRVFGLGAASGVLALGITYGGMLAKVYAEILESVNPAPAQALRQLGTHRALAILYGLIPQAAKEITSYTVYRWECAIRASVVMGFVGAGGLGQLMDQAMKMMNGGEAATILLTFMLLVFFADGLSFYLRRALDSPVIARASPLGWRSGCLTVCAVVAIIASFHLVQIDFSVLLSVESLRNMGQFLVSFFPPELSSAWLYKVLLSTGETLALSIIGTLLAVAAGFLLALPKNRAPFNFILITLRSVPELVWATLTVLAVGLGPFAGALALALHTTGVLGRLYAEALANASARPKEALVLSGAHASLAFFYGTLPNAAPQLIAYTLYRWEMNIRMAAILGFVGAGGLGQLLYFELSLFHMPEAATVIIAMLVLSIAVDQLSVWLRRWLR